MTDTPERPDEQEPRGANITFQYYGSQYPTPEQQQAMMRRLGGGESPDSRASEP